VIELRLLAYPPENPQCHEDYEVHDEARGKRHQRAPEILLAMIKLGGGARRSSTSSVTATAKTPSLRAASRSTLRPAIWL